MAWTSNQKKAIETRGGKILVSAAAGSGKTAVLSQRVLDFVLKNGDIDRLLVVTFTKAAAFEMKTRIKSKIEESILKNKDNAHLLKQLVLIDNAKITTMDSFYSEIVKQNFEKLGILPDFSILSSAEESLIKNKVIKRVLETSFDEGYFTFLLRVFGASDCNLIKDKVILVHDFLSTIPFYKDFINEVLEKYSGNYYKDLYLDSIKDKMTSYKNLYKSIKEELYNASSDFDKLSSNINEEENIINTLLEVKNFDELSKTLRCINFQKQATVRNHNEDYYFNKYKMIRKKLKDEVTNKLSYAKDFSDNEFLNQSKIIRKSLEYLFKIVIKFKEELLNEKKKINKFSFSDIPLFVIDLLIKDKKKTNLANSISNLFDEILIDEYQDTNELQSVIFNCISRDNNNLFLVGDIKQSIYRFRSACPDIFNNDKKNCFLDKFPMLICLSKNFRSRDSVLDFCNFIFENTMSSTLGEVSYDENEKLYVGASFPVNKDTITEIDIITDESRKEDDDELTSAQKEALYVADRVKSLIDSKYQVYDKKGFLRDIRPSDIALLFRNLTNSDLYRVALYNKGISSYCNKELTFFDNYDVKLIIALLKVIDNLYDDVSLAGVLTSSLFNITDEELAILKQSNKEAYLYDAIKNSNNEKLKGILDILKDLNNYALKNSIENTMNYVYNKLDVIDKVGLDKNKIKNLTIMIKNAKDFEGVCAKTFHEFVFYIDEILLDKSSFLGANPLSYGDNVLISTIHKSKGLEYPVVFLCQTGSKFNDKDIQKDFLIDSSLGICFDAFDYEKKCIRQSLSTLVLKSKIKRLQLSEELRVLYVALTRAREKIIITGCINNLSKVLCDASYLIGDEPLIDDLYLNESNSYLKWILACLLRHKDGKKLQSYANAFCKTFSSNANFKVEVIDSNLIKDEVMQEEKTKKKSVSYDEEIVLTDTIKIPKYLSVSEIKNENKNYYKKPYFLSSDVKATKIGSLYHKLIEVLKVKRYDIKTLKDSIKELVLKGFITNDEVSKIDVNKLYNYFSSDIYNMLLESKKYFKEKEISFLAPANLYDENLGDEEVLTSGIIDLLFLYDDTYFIVDYKTDNVTDVKELEKRYKKQLDLYEIGVKNVMKAKKVKKVIYSIKLNKFIEV